MRVHDLRGSFVTVNLANGKSEAWMSDRTGHLKRDDQSVQRTARTFAELKAGDFAQLDAAIPELAAPPIAHGIAHERSNRLKSLASPAGFEPASPT
jgi:hypothetical protein